MKYSNILFIFLILSGCAQKNPVETIESHNINPTVEIIINRSYTKTITPTITLTPTITMTPANPVITAELRCGGRDDWSYPQ